MSYLTPNSHSRKLDILGQQHTFEILFIISNLYLWIEPLLIREPHILLDNEISSIRFLFQTKHIKSKNPKEK